jgi:hypothetical protein
MKDTLKITGALVVGAGLMAGTQSLAADSLVPVGGDEEKPKNERKYLVPTLVPYSIEQVTAEIAALDGRINQLNVDLAELGARRAEKQALLEQLTAEVEKK